MPSFPLSDLISRVKSFKKLIKCTSPLVLPGAFNPLVAMAAEKEGFQALYLSGGALSASLGKPDIGLTTLEDLSHAVRGITSASKLPLLVDADTGFGDEVHTAATIRELIADGAAGCHLEDQVLPKRCGHLEGKELVSIKAMCEKLKAATKAKTDPDFFIIARTDAYAIEGIDGAINRAKAYLASGADGIFPEGLTTREEFQTFADAFPETPLLANMTEFGKTPFITSEEFGKLGYAMVIFPVTTLRLAMKSVIDGLREIKKTGTQEKITQKMQTRMELYALLKYDGSVEK